MQSTARGVSLEVVRGGDAAANVTVCCTSTAVTV
jgi:hypothetical protein